ncbi:hypothetical protein PoB_004263400 [Plakobranchus ocellatus]|uniref:Protein kinase domain-containing protein n=1 Tax=Plakobranchus ocellatus TaxID=259542 RepID=A0AAV4B7U2_9GAST|nr:hypothetical protein PoB_004263400 [Plakobranchus ocellatus]
MAESKPAPSSSFVYDLEEDFFDRFNLKKVLELGKGVSGEVFLTTSTAGPSRKLAVKVFSLDEEHRELNLRMFTTEVEIMRLYKIAFSQTILVCMRDSLVTNCSEYFCDTIIAELNAQAD